MSVPKIVLFYAFAPLPDPEAVRLWQRALASSLGLGGRIIVAAHGINATVGGDVAAVKAYVKQTRQYPAFADADYKLSDGAGDDFPRLSVRVRPELVTFGAPDEVRVDEHGVVGGGRRVAPEDLAGLLAERPDAVMFDGRNTMEARIGRFRGAVVPRAETTRDLLAELDAGAFDHLKDRPVITYCTGGVRCEVLSALMRRRGFAEVYQLDGGIVRYGEAFGSDGLWDGSLYVFDRRMHVEFAPGAHSLGRCGACGEPTADYANCFDPACRRMFLRCPACTAAGRLRECGQCTAAPRAAAPLAPRPPTAEPLTAERSPS
ncbi:rhodanese-related sulfurtransferase [Brevibacterium sp. BRM-1]|uniref:oxygen-dependent tRNA uridine(34) hydroxylase TrhO n=1 Tax=Brevibacterium sp. BRM-1 TaxID=2999062 RepID=UPI00227D9BB7|nr:rhodanese-related sulfurtransferase [Brevibacterium sp. BRM-1]WAL39879.1 rhodanese-related sulfurtransferase [Brevibacterium sp. BRM-1]